MQHVYIFLNGFDFAKYFFGCATELGLSEYFCAIDIFRIIIIIIIITRQVTRAMHVRNRVCPRVELI